MIVIFLSRGKDAALCSNVYNSGQMLPGSLAKLPSKLAATPSLFVKCLKMQICVSSTKSERNVFSHHNRI